MFRGGGTRHLYPRPAPPFPRTPGEGLQEEFTKPGRKHNRMNVGVQASVCAGVCAGKIRVWHYLPKTWNADAAATIYQKVLHPAMQKHRGVKRSYTILEDNDPTGYKSNAAKRMKESLRIRAHPFPRYSPDLSPLDFSLWQEVSNRMTRNQPKKVEGVEEYKRRLKRTALGLPSEVVMKAVRSMPRKIKEVSAARGACIRSD